VQLIFYLVYDPFKKKQEMETNPKSLPSNLTLLGFFTIGVLVYKKKKFKTPPPNKLGVIIFFVLVHWPPILKHLNPFHTQNLAPNGFSLKIWSNQH
jgi:hypothetical protein